MRTILLVFALVLSTLSSFAQNHFERLEKIAYQGIDTTIYKPYKTGDDIVFYTHNLISDSLQNNFMFICDYTEETYNQYKKSIRKKGKLKEFDGGLYTWENGLLWTIKKSDNKIFISARWKN